MSQAHSFALPGLFLAAMEVHTAEAETQIASAIAASSDSGVGSETSLSNLDPASARRLCNESEALVLGHGWETGQAVGGILGMPWYVEGKRTATLLAASAAFGGTLEVWHIDTEHEELRLASGYFGAWNEFRRISASTRFAKGSGLPGRVWESRTPTLFEELTESGAFLRADAARSIGLEFGLGLPVDYPDGFGVAVLLSTRTTPIARSVDIWRLHGKSEIEHLQGLSLCTSLEARNSVRAAAKSLALTSGSRFSPIAIDVDLAKEFAHSSLPAPSGFAWPSRDATGVVHVATLMS